jgi:hypothetical protein
VFPVEKVALERMLHKYIIIQQKFGGGPSWTHIECAGVRRSVNVRGRLGPRKACLNAIHNIDPQRVIGQDERAISHHERMAVIRRIRRTPALAFGPAESLPADALDDTNFSGPVFGTERRDEQASRLAAVLAEDGELPARPAGASTWKLSTI